MSRGYFGIGIESVKTPANVGGLWRSAQAFGASYMFTIGARYPKRCAPDTTDAAAHVPLFGYEDVTEFLALLPDRSRLVGVEIDERARALPDFKHPERAVYVLGAEDRGLSDAMVAGLHDLVQIPSAYCLNVATAGSVVLYDRTAKA